MLAGFRQVIPLPPQCWFVEPGNFWNLPGVYIGHAPLLPAVNRGSTRFLPLVTRTSLQSQPLSRSPLTILRAVHRQGCGRRPSHSWSRTHRTCGFDDETAILKSCKGIDATAPVGDDDFSGSTFQNLHSPDRRWVIFPRVTSRIPGFGTIPVFNKVAEFRRIANNVKELSGKHAGEIRLLINNAT